MPPEMPTLPVQLWGIWITKEARGGMTFFLWNIIQMGWNN